MRRWGGAPASMGSSSCSRPSGIALTPDHYHHYYQHRATLSDDSPLKYIRTVPNCAVVLPYSLRLPHSTLHSLTRANAGQRNPARAWDLRHPRWMW